MGDTLRELRAVSISSFSFRPFERVPTRSPIPDLVVAFAFSPYTLAFPPWSLSILQDLWNRSSHLFFKANFFDNFVPSLLQPRKVFRGCAYRSHKVPYIYPYNQRTADLAYLGPKDWTPILCDSPRYPILHPHPGYLNKPRNQFKMPRFQTLRRRLSAANLRTSLRRSSSASTQSTRSRDSFGSSTSSASSTMHTINAVLVRQPSIAGFEEEKRSSGHELGLLEPRPIVYWGGLEERMMGSF